MTPITCLVMTSLIALCALCGEDFELIIMHTNDIHARFDQFNKYGSRCSHADAEQGKCFGGYARLKTAVNEVRRQHFNTLFLDAGDQYQGTVYFYYYADKITSFFMNWVQYDAMALGNHEFDNGVEGVVPFLQDLNSNVVSANIDAAQEPTIQGLFQKSAVINKFQELSVGVVGYTTPNILHPGRLQFNDVVESVTQEVRNLTSQGVKIIIALGHAGFAVDLEVAKIPGVDVVIGGHSNTFLYTGQAPSDEVPVGQYPTVVTQDDGNKSVVAQCYTWAKYLCVLNLNFSKHDGRLLSWGGNPWLLDSSVTEDPATLVQLRPWKEMVERLTAEVVGQTTVKLEGDRKVCRTQECNLGNLITDSMVAQNQDHPDKLEWKDVNIAITNGGSIRASIDIGNITVNDVLTVLPFNNTIDLFKIQGRYLKETFEYCASRMDPCGLQKPFGGYLQVSGLRVTYDLNQPLWQRVVSLKALCSGCSVPRFEPVDDLTEYKMMVSSYIARGRKGYQVLKNHARLIYSTGDVGSDMMIKYLKKMSPVSQGVEGRITYLHNSNVCNTSGT